jgi:hypothetical protein
VPPGTLRDSGKQGAVMQIIAQLNQWWNLIFVLPFALGVVLVVLSVLGTAGRRSGSRHPARATSSGRIAVRNISRRSASGLRLQAGHARSAARSQSIARGRVRIATGRRQSRSVAQRIQRQSKPSLPVVHLGNLPPLMLLQNFLLFWGIFGWAANQYFARIQPDPGRFIILSLLTTIIGSLIVTVTFSALLSRFTPTDETYAVTRWDLVGRTGEAVSTITHRMGSVYARDESGTLHHLPVRVQSGGDSIAKGRSVLVIDYDAEGDFYWVKEWSPDTELSSDRTLYADSESTIEAPEGSRIQLLHAQTAKPYRAWRWLVGSNPPSLFLSSHSA